MRSISKYIVDEEIEENEFLRECLKDLANQKIVDADVFSAEFKPLEKGYRSIAQVKAVMTIVYSATICKNKERKVKVREKVQNPTTKRIEEKVSYRTEEYVEEYQYNNDKSFSLNKTFCPESCVFDDDEKLNRFVQNFESWKSSREIKEVSILPQSVLGGKSDINDAYYNQISNELEKSGIKNIKNNLPGDSYKDLTYSCKVNFYVKIYALPLYMLEYTYKSKNYISAGFITKAEWFLHNAPIVDSEVENMSYKKHEKLCLASFITMCSSLSAFVFIMILRLFGVFRLNITIFILSLVFAIASIVLGCVSERKLKTSDEELYNELMIKRQENLNKKLIELGLD